MISKHVLHSCSSKYTENISETETLLGKQYHLQYNQLFIVFGPPYYSVWNAKSKQWRQ